MALSPPLTFCKVKTRVSSPSADVSSVIVNSKVADVLPALIVISVVLYELMSALEPVPSVVKATSTLVEAAGDTVVPGVPEGTV